MTSKVALIYPPTADPTAPYASLPVLAGALRAAGIDPLLIDANLEDVWSLLEAPPQAGGVLFGPRKFGPTIAQPRFCA